MAELGDSAESKFDSSLVLSRVLVPLSFHSHTRSVTKIRDDILSNSIRVVMFGCIIAGSLCSIVFVLSCVAACCKISVADCQLLK